MLAPPVREEIDHRTIKLIVGIVALSLAGLTDFFATQPLASISASYYEGGLSQIIFIGFTFTISALLLAYNGQSKREMVMSKVGAVANLGVPLFPCACGGHEAPVPFVHTTAATVTFLILAYFCFEFYRRARAKAGPRAKVRCAIYAACGIAIIVGLGMLVVGVFTGDAAGNATKYRPTFYGEMTNLVAFGISWLTASRVLPGITAPHERFSPLRASNPP